MTLGDVSYQGKGYICPHAYRDHWAAQQYLLKTLRGKTFYTPSTLNLTHKNGKGYLEKHWFGDCWFPGNPGKAKSQVHP
ncbi:MAG: hypothetical protein LBF75_02265 [Treponema sp.]|jgi:replication-associated recombination protein RarA|nr:hypothetical protein [Treponema sp.]